jgi:Kef-type K+ transport system membrane component KefB
MNMTEAAIPTLALIAVAAVMAPLLAEQTRDLRVPAVVIEILLGILLGPYVFKLAHLNGVVTALSDIGLSFLMFLAGYELELSRLKGRPIRLAAVGWLISLAIALGIAFALVSSGLAIDTVVVGLALTTTALGTLLPIVSDAGILNTRFGSLLVSIGTVGEFGPICAVAVLLTRKDPRITISLLIAFGVIALGTAFLATRAHLPKIVALFRRHLHSSSQLPVRVSLCLVLALVYLAFELGLDVLLGAFAAGIVFRLLSTGVENEVIESKLEAIGFGFLVPIFFVVSGIRFDLHILLTNSSALLRLVLFLGLMLLVRGLPVLILYKRDLPTSERVPLALFSATGLPLIVVITTIGVSEGRMLPENAAALVGAGMLSVLLFPAIGLRMLRHATAAGTEGDPREPEGELDHQRLPSQDRPKTDYDD